MLYDKSYDGASNKYTFKYSKTVKDVNDNDVEIPCKQRFTTEEEVSTMLAQAEAAKARQEVLIAELQNELAEIAQMKAIK